MRAFLLLFFLLSNGLCALQGEGSLAVIVNPDSGINSLTKEEVINIFLGRQKQLGETAVRPVDQVPKEHFARFYKLLVNKDASEIQTYWARLFFSGQAQPPRKIQTAEEVLRFVSAHRGGIGYVDKSKVNDKVKVALILEGQ